MNHDAQDLIHRSPDVSPSGTFQETVLARVRRHRRRHRHARGSAAIALTLVFTLLVGQRRLGWGLPAAFPSPSTARVTSADRGVSWLLETQRPDGGWSAGSEGGHDRFTLGVSALATLALLHAPEPAPRDRVDAALEYLHTTLSKESPLFREGPDFYNILFGLTALQEAERLMPDPARRALLDRAITGILRQQRPSGGWGYPASTAYGYRDTAPPNSAVTWWVVQVLRRESRLPENTAALARAEAWLTSRFANPDHPEYRLQGVPASGPDSALYWMAHALADTRPATRPVSRNPDAYRDYVRTRVVPSSIPLATLRRNQQRNGSWHQPDDRWWQAGGRVYLTALNVLAQVPHGV